MRGHCCEQMIIVKFVNDDDQFVFAAACTSHCQCDRHEPRSVCGEDWNSDKDRHWDWHVKW